MDGFEQKVWVVGFADGRYGILTRDIVGVYLNEEDANVAVDATKKEYEGVWVEECVLK